MRIIIDTNVLLNVFLPRSSNYWIWEALLNGELTLCVTSDILLEYEEIIQRFYGNKQLADYVIDAILAMPDLVVKNKTFFWRMIPKDEDDEKFADCFVATSAFCIITKDKHFNVLKKNRFPPFQVLIHKSSKQFLKRIKTLRNCNKSRFFQNFLKLLDLDTPQYFDRF
jgi:uncharacterized protein